MENESNKDVEKFAEILKNEGIKAATLQLLLEYIYARRGIDDVAKDISRKYAEQLEEQAAAVQEEERKRMLAIAGRIKNATDEDNAKKLVDALYAAFRYYGGKASHIRYGKSSDIQYTPQITEQAVLDYAALLRAKEKMIRWGKHTKEILNREDDIKKAYKDYLTQKLSAGTNDAEKAMILQGEMNKLHQATYRDTVREQFNKFWRKGTGWRMVISGVLFAGAIGALFLNPFVGAFVGAGLMIARGAWSGLGTWFGFEALYDKFNHAFRRSKENGGERAIRNILKNEDVSWKDMMDAVYGDDKTIAENLVEGGMKVAKNVRKHRGIKRTFSVLLGVAVGLATGIVQGIMHLLQPHEAAVGGVGFVDHVKDAAHSTHANAVADTSAVPDTSFTYIAEPGGSLWNVAKSGIAHYCAVNGVQLDHNQQIYAIDWLKDRMVEDPQAFGVDKWVPGHDHWIYQGEDIHINSDWMKEAVDKAKEFYAGKGTGAANATFNLQPTSRVKWVYDTVEGKWGAVPLKLKRM
ncbi:MAG: hypothetical protein ACPL06_01200 [Candidatus Anstonellales archaeon]